MNEVTGAQLMTWRTDQNLSQRDVAQLLGVTQGPVNRWENGQEIPGPAKKLLALLMNGTAPFASSTDAASDDLTKKNLLPHKLTFEDWEALTEDARVGGFRNVRDYVQHWLKEKAAEVRGKK